MRIPRIYTGQPLAAGTLLELDSSAARHVHQVLRLKAGHELQLFNGSGAEFSAVIDSADRKRVNVRVEQQLPARVTESPLQIHLGIAISKGDRMDWVLQKATELGAGSITPLFSRRVDVKLNEERRAKKQQHWQQVIISACEQCGRNRLPELGAATELNAWLPTVEAERKFVLAPGENALSQQQAAGSVALLIGPEGGLEEGEIQAAAQAGFTPLALGPRILRTETAPLAAIAILQHLWGDL